MSYTITRTEVLVTNICHECGILYATPEGFRNSRKRDQGTFYCPNGHPAYYTESEADKVRKELAREQHRREQAEAEATRQREYAESVERRLSAARGAHTKTKKRIAAGICPCCRRPFANLMRHMAGQHPDYAQPLGAEE